MLVRVRACVCVSVVHLVPKMRKVPVVKIEIAASFTIPDRPRRWLWRRGRRQQQQYQRCRLSATFSSRISSKNIYFYPRLRCAKWLPMFIQYKLTEIDLRSMRRNCDIGLVVCLCAQNSQLLPHTSDIRNTHIHIRHTATHRIWHTELEHVRDRASTFHLYAVSYIRFYSVQELCFALKKIKQKKNPKK